MILKIAIILVAISLFSSILYGTDRVTSENPSDAASIKIGCRHEAERETAVSEAKTVDFHHQHPGLGKVLGKVSDGFGMVDYEALKKDQSALDSYLKLTASVPRAQFEGWTRPQRMAFLINLYNASTIKLMAECEGFWT